MAPFQSMLAADAVAVFANPMEFGEGVIYTPRGGNARTIRAVVTRGQRDPVAGGRPAPLLEIFVPFHATYGITAPPDNEDKFEVAERFGGTPEPFYNVAVVSSDAGGFTLRLR